MKKVTIKHFLETKVKPIETLDGSFLYPIYCRVTYNRKTTNFKSFTDIYFTELEFSNYLSDVGSINISLYSDLHKELREIKTSVYVLVTKNENLSVYDSYFVENIKAYISPLNIKLLEFAWFAFLYPVQTLAINPRTNKSEKIKPLTIKQVLDIPPTDEELRLKKIYPNNKLFLIDELYNSFNKQRTLLANISVFRQIFNLNIEDYFYKDTIASWQIIEAILTLYGEKSVIHFLTEFQLDKIFTELKKLGFEIEANKVQYVVQRIIKSIPVLEHY